MLYMFIEKLNIENRVRSSRIQIISHYPNKMRNIRNRLIVLFGGRVGHTPYVPCTIPAVAARVCDGYVKDPRTRNGNRPFSPRFSAFSLYVATDLSVIRFRRRFDSCTTTCSASIINAPVAIRAPLNNYPSSSSQYVMATRELPLPLVKTTKFERDGNCFLNVIIGNKYSFITVRMTVNEAITQIV